MGRDAGALPQTPQGTLSLDPFFGARLERVTRHLG